MKKLIAMLLCFALVAALGATAAFAAMPDVDSADKEIVDARTATKAAAQDAYDIKALDEVAAAVKKYEAVRFDPSKTKDQVDAAKAALDAKLTAIAAKYPDASVDLTSYDTSTAVATAKAAKQVDQAAQKLAAAQNVAWKDYYLTKGTKMDVNALAIGLAKLSAAADLADAQAAAAAAKTGAAAAQATAKSLIADAVKAAQDAAATAVANAQADAYKTLSDNYADAVEAFWAEVEAAWF